MVNINEIKIIDFLLVESYYKNGENLPIDSDNKKSIIFIQLKLFMSHFN